MKQFFDISVIYLSGDWAMEMNITAHNNTRHRRKIWI